VNTFASVKLKEGPTGSRVNEHRKEVESVTGAFSRAEKTRAANITNKSAVMDHICNDIIEWDSDKVTHQ